MQTGLGGMAEGRARSKCPEAGDPHAASSGVCTTARASDLLRPKLARWLEAQPEASMPALFGRKQ
eukprot:2429622-Alexandrium_andersonii.AAC.1